MDGSVFQPLVAIAGGAFDQYEAVLELLQVSYKAQDGVVDPPSSVTRLTLEQVIADAKAGDLLTAEAEDETITGCIFCKTLFNEAGPYLYMYHMAVSPLRQGKGVGSALLRTAETLARGRGIDRMQVMSRVELVDNHAFFERHGFREVGFFTHNGYHRPTSVRFEKLLEANDRHGER